MPLTAWHLVPMCTRRKRTRFKLAVHAANIAFMSHFGQKSALDTLSLSAARFAFKVAFDSKAVAVAMGVLGRPLPWFCHIVVAAAQLAAVAGTNVSCCTQVSPPPPQRWITVEVTSLPRQRCTRGAKCPTCTFPAHPGPTTLHSLPPALLFLVQLSAEADDLLRVRMTSLMRGLNYVAQPAFWITGSPLDTLLLPHTPASRCWLVYTFVTVVVGVVMPSVALYCMELAARRRFASARGMRLKLISINPSALHAMPAAPLSSATLLFLGVEALSGVWIVLVGTAHLVGRTAWL